MSAPMKQPVLRVRNRSEARDALERAFGKRPWPLFARYPGVCKGCGERIDAGDKIQYIGGEGAAHDDECLLRWARAAGK